MPNENPLQQLSLTAFFFADERSDSLTFWYKQQVSIFRLKFHFLCEFPAYLGEITLKFAVSVAYCYTPAANGEFLPLYVVLC